MSMIIFLIYGASWLFSLGAMLADIQSVGDKSFADKYYRRDFSTCCLLAALPIANILIAIFVTGFMEHGWRLSRRDQ